MTRNSIMKNKYLTPYFLMLPAVIFYLIFWVFPLSKTFYYSFTDWNIIGEAHFVDIKNYVKIFTDQDFWKSVLHSLEVVAAAPVGLSISYLVAIGVNSIIRGKTFFRSTYFFTTLVSVVVTAVIFKFMFATENGFINYFLESIRLQKIQWFNDGRWAMVMVTLTCVWKGIGWNAILFLSGLQSIDSQLYESAYLDGASPVTIIRKITTPLMKPTILFTAVMAVISALQTFPQVNVLTGGGPARETETVFMYIYNNAFKYRYAGIACAAAVIFAIIVFIISNLQFTLLEKD